MLVTKHYFLPEDKHEFNLENQAVAMSLAIDDIKNYLRTKIKYEELTDKEYEVYDNNRSTSFTLSSVTYELIDAKTAVVILSGSGTVNNADTDSEGNTIKTIQAVIDFSNTSIDIGPYYLVFTVIFSTSEKEIFRVSYQVKNYKANY